MRLNGSLLLITLSLSLPLVFADVDWAVDLEKVRSRQLEDSVRLIPAESVFLSGPRSKQNTGTDDRQVEANRLLDKGIEQANLSDWQGALTTWQQALTIYQEIVNRAGEVATLNNIDNVNAFWGKNNAEAVLAGLWRVDDAGTSLLMQRFYEILATQQVTKAEALQQAQLSLLKREEDLTERLRAIELGQGIRGSLVPADAVDVEESSLSHPYYWAPFILIGNSL